MHFTDREHDALKDFLTQELVKICDVDPIVFADYIIALLKHDKDTASLKKEVNEQLVDFIPENTAQFVDFLFTVLNEKSYIEEMDLDSAGSRERSRERSRSPDRSRYHRDDDRDRRDDRRRDDRRERDRDHYRERDREPRKRKECYEFQEKGYCVRGSDCRYEHVEKKTMRQKMAQYGHERDRSAWLVVENIPQEHSNPESITEYFSQFGELTQVIVNPEQQKAELEYKSHEEAKRCHSSPEAIFGNRFVKVYWRKVEKQRPQPVSAEILRANLARKEEKRKQALAAQAEQKRQLAELQKNTKEVIQKQMEEQQKVMDKLRDPNLSVDERAVLMKGLEMLQESIKTLMGTQTTAKPTPKPYKKKTYERTFVLDASEMDTDPIPQPTFRLDNRPKQFKLSNLTPEQDAILFQHYSQFSGFQAVIPVDDGRIINFATRREAELALTRPPSGNHVRIEWYQPTEPHAC